MVLCFRSSAKYICDDLGFFFSKFISVLMFSGSNQCTLQYSYCPLGYIHNLIVHFYAQSMVDFINVLRCVL